jgi:hypothetical protein
VVASRRFLKKAAQNFYDSGAGAFAKPAPMTQKSESLFAAFSSEKEVLALRGYRD